MNFNFYCLYIIFTSPPPPIHFCVWAFTINHLCLSLSLSVSLSVSVCLSLSLSLSVSLSLCLCLCLSLSLYAAFFIFVVVTFQEPPKYNNRMHVSSIADFFPRYIQILSFETLQTIGTRELSTGQANDTAT